MWSKYDLNMVSYVIQSPVHASSMWFKYIFKMDQQDDSIRKPWGFQEQKWELLDDV